MNHIHAFCAMLEGLIKDESEARQGYYNFLEQFDGALSEREKDAFREIIAEELKHTELLNQMIYRRNGIIAENRLRAKN